MRRPTLVLLLSMLLVFVQHGAVQHALGHLSHADRPAGATLEVAPAADTTACGACTAFTQVSTPAFGAGPDLALAPLHLAPGQAIAPAPAVAAALTPRSRGPPVA